MSIQSIGSTSTVAATTGSDSNGNPRSGIRQDFKSLESALLNGDLTGAQGAFASLQQALGAVPTAANPTSVFSQLGQSGSTLGQDMQAVSAALGNNDIGGAQKAFAKLQQDMQAAFQANGASGAHHGHHAHHAHGNDGDADDGPSASSTLSATPTSAAASLTSVLQALASNNPKLAADLTSVINDLNGTGAVVNTTA